MPLYFVNTGRTHRYRTPVKVIGFIFQTPLPQHAASIYFGGFRFIILIKECVPVVIFDYKTQYSNGQENWLLTGACKRRKERSLEQNTKTLNKTKSQQYYSTYWSISKDHLNGLWYKQLRHGYKDARNLVSYLKFTSLKKTLHYLIFKAIFERRFYMKRSIKKITLLIKVISKLQQ